MNNILLVNFIDLTLEEKMQILEWRNNSKIRESMYNQSEITKKQHLNFISSLNSDDSKRYFLVKSNNKSIGVIDFTQIIHKESLHMGIYANPNARGNGKILMNKIIKYAFDILDTKKIYSEVFLENIRAFELYKKFGFKQFSIKNINDKQVICMELDYENRNV